MQLKGANDLRKMREKESWEHAGVIHPRNDRPPSPAALHRGATGVLDARRMLRDRTRDLHEEAEAVLGDAPMRNVRDYRRMVRATFEMTEAVIRAVDAYLPERLKSGIERDRVRLQADLAYLGMPSSVGSSGLEIGTKAGALGALYVCEGSKLGARVIARQVEAQLSLTAAHGASYLHGDQAAAGARWGAFIKILNSDVTGRAELQDALLAARRVFHLLIDSYETEKWQMTCKVPVSDRRP